MVAHWYLALLLVFFATAAEARTPSPVGRWKVKVSPSRKLHDEMEPELVKHFRLIIRKNGTFDFSMVSPDVPPSEKVMMDGSWKAEGKEFVCTFLRVEGVPFDEAPGTELQVKTWTLKWIDHQWVVTPGSFVGEELVLFR
jgi:hypothetical protein